MVLAAHLGQTSSFAKTEETEEVPMPQQLAPVVVAAAVAPASLSSLAVDCSSPQTQEKASTETETLRKFASAVAVASKLAIVAAMPRRTERHSTLFF